MPKKQGSLTTLERWFASGEIINNVLPTTGQKFEFECSETAFSNLSALVSAGLMALQAHNFENYLRNGQDVGDIATSEPVQELFAALLKAVPVDSGTTMECCPKQLSRIQGDGGDFLGQERYNTPPDAEHADIFEIPDCKCQFGFLKIARGEFLFDFTDCTLLYVADPIYTYPIDVNNVSPTAKAVDFWNFVGMLPNVRGASTNGQGGSDPQYPPAPTQQGGNDPSSGQPPGWDSWGGSSYDDDDNDNGGSGGFDFNDPRNHDW